MSNSGDKSAFADQTQTESKFMRKVKESPFMPIGLFGCICAVGYGAYNYKKRGEMSTSVYLMQLRVKAQGMVVGALTLGIVYNLVSRYMNRDKDDTTK